MSAIAQQESLVKESLFHFITRNIPSADLNVIDDIVLSYVISILEEASQDPCFDVDGFVEMMAAYMPEFSRIERAQVSSWVIELEAELSRRDETDSLNDDSAGSDRINLTLQSLSEMLPPAAPAKAVRSHTNSESSEGAEGGRRAPMMDGDELSAQCGVLQEMFPNTCTMEIKHCVSIANGDVERAAATLLHRREQGQALSAAALHTVTSRQPLCDDSELKSRIIARYSYVDKNSDQKEHKPLAPKIEPKKMVRYRDNKIVSLKGERYTEVSGIDRER
ncbi:CUE domain-containing protein 2 [Ostrinia nubilalis]|uniref:CUE domain-containing protein 2 n=1 Tax=Ostrinia nubilalis TaxID=29057 RepID=UPI00308245E1